MIWPGQMLCFTAQYARAVHASCRRLQRLTIKASSRMFAGAGGAAPLPHGLRADTLNTYRAEWSRYVHFAARLGYAPDIPGRDTPWTAFLLWRYLLFRSERCKPSTVFAGLSALAHFGHYHRHVLPTRKEDGNALLHRDIANMKREIAIYYCAKKGIQGLTYDVQHSTPLAKNAVELILSAFEVFDESRFQRLQRVDRHHIVASVLQHTKGMRFGHFLFRDYTVNSFVLGSDGTYRLTTDWHRYQGQRRYVLEFAATPRWPCLRYQVRRLDLSVAASLTAAHLLRWHFAMLAKDSERLLFRPHVHTRPSRQDRRTWLQRALTQALPEDEVDARAVIKDVTPHAWRAGIAGDLVRAEVSWNMIAMWCRWHSMRAMRMYASRPPLGSARRSARFRLIAQ